MQIPGEANPELMGIFLFGVSNESETYPGGIWHKKSYCYSVEQHPQHFHLHRGVCSSKVPIFTSILILA